MWDQESFQLSYLMETKHIEVQTSFCYEVFGVEETEEMGI